MGGWKPADCTSWLLARARCTTWDNDRGTSPAAGGGSGLASGGLAESGEGAAGAGWVEVRVFRTSSAARALARSRSLGVVQPAASTRAATAKASLHCVRPT
jgi:hypothetical protein